MAVFAGLQPTALAWWNAVLGVAFALALATAGSRAGRNSVYWMVAVAAVASALTNPFWAIPALVGAGLNAWSPANQRRNPLRSLAVVGGFGSLINIGSLGMWALPSVITAVAIVPVFVSAYRRDNRHNRKLARTALAVIALLGVAIGGAAALSGAQAYQQVTAAQTQLTKVRQGFSFSNLDESVATARGQLQIAEQALEATSGTLTGPLGRIGRLAPIASQHLNALDVAATSAQRALGAGIAMLDAADGATNSTSLFDPDRIDTITTAATRAEPIFVEASSRLRTTSRDWLIPPAAQALDDSTELARQAGIATTTTVDLGATLPGLLGFAAPTRYLVLFATPAESRELGGFVGAYGVVEFNAGEPSLVAVGDNEILGLESARLGRSLPADGYTPWYRDYEPATYPQNVTGSVDFNVVADASLALFDGLNGSELDGIIYADPFALEAIASLGPPIELSDAEGRPLTLDATTTASFLLRDQYRAFPRASDRTKALIAVFEQSFSAIGASLQSRPVDVITTLAPMVDQGRLQVAPADTRARDVLAKYGLVRSLPPPGGTDFVSVVQTNATTSKLDAYLSRDVRYVVDLDPATGALTANVVVTLANSADDSLPEYVYGAPDPRRDRARSTDSVLLSVFTPHDLAAITIDDTPVANFRSFTDAGYQRHMIQVDIPANQSVVVNYTLLGSVNRGNYALTVASQPLSTPDNWSVELITPPKWRVDSGSEGDPARFEGPLTEDLALLWVLSS